MYVYVRIFLSYERRWRRRTARLAQCNLWSLRIFLGLLVDDLRLVFSRLPARNFFSIRVPSCKIRLNESTSLFGRMQFLDLLFCLSLSLLRTYKKRRRKMRNERINNSRIAPHCFSIEHMFVALIYDICNTTIHFLIMNIFICFR